MSASKHLFYGQPTQQIVGSRNRGELEKLREYIATGPWLMVPDKTYQVGLSVTSLLLDYLKSTPGSCEPEDLEVLQQRRWDNKREEPLLLFGQSQGREGIEAVLYPDLTPQFKAPYDKLFWRFDPEKTFLAVELLNFFKEPDKAFKSTFWLPTKFLGFSKVSSKPGVAASLELAPNQPAPGS